MAYAVAALFFPAAQRAMTAATPDTETGDG